MMGFPQEEFDAWLAEAQVTRGDFALTVADVGFQKATELVNERIERTVPTRKQIAEVVESLRITIAFDSRDWGETQRDAWLYGIILGWDGPDSAMSEVAAQYGWSDATVERLRRLHSTLAMIQNGADHE